MRSVLFDDLAISCVICDVTIDYTEENINIDIYIYKITFYIIISVLLIRISKFTAVNADM